MDKIKIITGASVILIIVLSIATMFATQTRTRNFGGNTTIELEPGQKLEEITWKDDSLWYVTRPMRDDEFAETHTFQQSSVFGVFEGTVTIVESEQETD